MQNDSKTVWAEKSVRKRIPGEIAFPWGKVAKPKVLTDEGKIPSR